MEESLLFCCIVHPVANPWYVAYRGMVTDILRGDVQIFNLVIVWDLFFELCRCCGVVFRP